MNETVVDQIDPRVLDLRQHIVDAAIAESLPPPLAEKFLASLARVEAARKRIQEFSQR